MRFRDIIGQEHVKQQLRLSVQENRVPHAQLFEGASGVGKLQLAIAYAQYLACPNRTEEDSCGVCPTCLQYQRLEHPDLHFVFPIYKEKSTRDSVCDDFIGSFREIVLKKHYFDFNDWFAFIEADNKQGVIYEAESGEILRKLSLKAYGNGFKTMIIWLPEKMHPACANKLLKILEEPPEQTLFLLVSEEPELLLTTILSRCQHIRVPRLDEDTIVRALREEHEGMDIQMAIDIAHVANGSYLQAQRALQNTQQETKNQKAFVSLMRNAWLVGQKKNYDALLELRVWADNMAKNNGREEHKNFLQYMQKQVRENFIRNFGHAEMNYQTHAEAEFSQKFAPFINENNVEQLMNQLDLAQRQIEQNGSVRIIFFDLCLQLIVLIKK